MATTEDTTLAIDITWHPFVVARVVVPAATVLIRNRSPSPVRQWTRHRVSIKTDRVGGVDQLVRYRAQVGPIVTEVEDIQELPAGFQHRQLRRTDRHHGLFVVPVRVGVGNASWARFERCSGANNWNS